LTSHGSCSYPLNSEGGIHEGADHKRRSQPSGPRRLAKAETNTHVARRLLAIATALSGMSQKDAAEAAALGCQALREGDAL
jgi:hypothetical protein